MVPHLRAGDQAKYTDSIKNFPTPQNISQVRLWYSLENQVAYCFCKIETMAPFSQLLSPGNVLVWDAELEQAFIASKAKIVELIQEGVYSFDPQACDLPLHRLQQ